jgi:hypothetical protein
MCRWLAYTGSPVLLTQVLYTPVHSLIDQSLHSRLGAETTWCWRSTSRCSRTQGTADTEVLFYLALTFGPGR